MNTSETMSLLKVLDEIRDEIKKQNDILMNFSSLNNPFETIECPTYTTRDGLVALKPKFKEE